MQLNACGRFLFFISKQLDCSIQTCYHFSIKLCLFLNWGFSADKLQFGDFPSFFFFFLLKKLHERGAVRGLHVSVSYTVYVTPD